MLMSIISLNLSEEETLVSWKAKYKKVCKFEKMMLPSDIADKYNVDTYIAPDTIENRYAWSRSLTFMRDKMISECDVRISAGGTMSGYLGSMPGVLEEIFFAIQKKKPIYLLGGYGGITAKVCSFLKTNNMPDELTLNWQMENNKFYSELLEEYTRLSLNVDYSWIKKLSIESLNNGLSKEENLKLFDTPFPDEAICLIARGLRNLHFDT